MKNKMKMQPKTISEVETRKAEMEFKRDYDLGLPFKDDPLGAEFFKGYLAALQWVLGESEEYELRKAKRIAEIIRDNNLPGMAPNANDRAEAEVDFAMEEAAAAKAHADPMAGLDGLSGCEHPRAFYEKEEAGKKARTYRIPERLAHVLWTFEESGLESDMSRTFTHWKEGTFSDKKFFVEMEEYLKVLREFRESLLSEALGRAIHDSQQEDVEWMEPPAKTEVNDGLPF